MEVLVMNDFIIGRIRTGAQLVAGVLITWLTTYLINQGFDTEFITDLEGLTPILAGFLVMLFTLLWREIVDYLARTRNPLYGWLNGYPTTPNYKSGEAVDLP